MKSILLCFIAGFIYAFGFPLTWAPSFFLMPIIGMALFMSQFHVFNPKKEYRFKKELLNFFAFSFAIYLFGYYWIPYTMEQFGEIPFPLNYLVGSLFTLIALPQYFLFFILYYFVRKKYDTALPLWLIAFILTALDYFTPQQFPAHIGHSWIQLKSYLGLSQIFGYSIFSFTSYWLSMGLLRFVQQKRPEWNSLLFFIIVLGLSFSFPLSRQKKIAQTTQIRMVQANIGNFLKVDSEKGGVTSRKVVDDRYWELSTAPTDQPLDLIIWPETSYPRLMSSSTLQAAPHLLPSLIRKISQETGAEIFLGGYDRNPNSNLFSSFESEYNTGFFIDDQGRLKDYYHKIKLIPFGEGLPFGPLNEFLSRYLNNISFFAKGNQYTLFKTRKDIPFINLICYEILFPRFVLNFLDQLKERPQFIINLTNDSWYGDTSEPYHHLLLSKWRAIELNIPIVRMTNTGISSVIYPDGSESRRTGIYKKENLDHGLITSPGSATLYEQFGFLNLTGLVLLIGLLSFLSKKLKTPPSKDHEV